MPTYSAPGVYVTESLAGPQPTPISLSPSQAAFMGEHWRGPVGYAVQCNSWSDFVKYFGGFNPNATPVLANAYLAYAAYEYFANGGQCAWIARVAAALTPGASASINLKDSQATPANTLSLTAGILGVTGNPGTWGNNLYVQVVANSTGTGRFNLYIYYGGNTAPYIVEQWNDLSMTKTDPRYAPNVINSPTSGSIYVVATDLGDAAAAPNNMPVALAAGQFSGGIDPADPANSDYITALTYGASPPTSPFDAIPNVLNFNLPGITTTAVVNQAILYAQSRPSTFLVIDTPSGLTPAGAVAYYGSLSPVSSYAALYYPWVTAINPSQSNLASTILLPPGAFVLGQMDATDSTFGVWVAPAGTDTVLANVVKTERTFSMSDLGALTSSSVNALRTMPNGQVIIWGVRTMNQQYASFYVPIRRFLNYIEAFMTDLLNPYVFSPNDYVTWGAITAVLQNYLSTLYTQGAFPGSTPALSYYVLCNASNNPQSAVAQGILNVQVGVALIYPAEFIALNITQFQPSGTTIVTTSTP